MAGLIEVSELKDIYPDMLRWIEFVWRVANPPFEVGTDGPGDLRGGADAMIIGENVFAWLEKPDLFVPIKKSLGWSVAKPYISHM